MNTETAKHIILIHVGDPGMNKVGMAYPPNNWIGTILLHRVLELALLREGNAPRPPSGGLGPLNDCVLYFAVVDREAAIETMRTELKAVMLLAYCQIGVSDGCRLQCVYPSPAVKMEWLVDTERQELFRSQVTQNLERVLRESERDQADNK